MTVLAGCAHKQQPAATAVPAETHIQICVVDTIAPGGMMNIGAIVSTARGDTTVLQSEGRVPLRQLVAGPKVLSQATWINARQPLQLAAGTRLRFAPTGAPRAYAAGTLGLLGVFRGLPIFVRAGEQGRMRAEVEALSARGIDLEKALQQRATLRRNAERLTNLYVPTALAGCVFQQLRKTQARR